MTVKAIATVKKFAIGAAMTLTLSSTAHAWGALAIAQEGNMIIGTGGGTGFASESIARETALKDCAGQVRKRRMKTPCRVVETFRRQCLTLAHTDTAPGHGWALGATAAEADRKALEICRATPGRVGACKIVGSDCDK